jgi:hypothetical protein
MRPLEESKRIDVGSTHDSNIGTTLVAWLNAIQRHMIATGINSVAYVVKPKTGALCPLNDSDIETKCTETNLFKDWGQVLLVQVKEFIEAVTTNNCPIDLMNSRYAITFLRGSAGPNLKQRSDNELLTDVSGTEFLYFIIMKLQATSATSGRKLVASLIAVKLSQFKGFHVVECSTKIQDICIKLTGLGDSYVPSDIRHPTSDIRHPTSDIRHPTSDIRHPTSDILHPTSDIRHPTSDIRHPTSDIRHPTSDIRHPTSRYSCFVASTQPGSSNLT